MLQRVVDETGTAADVVIEAGFANADASTGAYEVSVPATAARAALHGQALAPADNPGRYTISAKLGTQTKTAEVDVTANAAIADFNF